MGPILSPVGLLLGLVPCSMRTAIMSYLVTAVLVMSGPVVKV